MKKTFLYALLLLASALQLTSCEIYINDNEYGYEDRRRASTISGQWRGNLNMFYSMENPYTGQIMEFDASESYIIFYSDHYGASYGTGKQIDHYLRGPLRERYHFFTWEVRNGVLYLDFPGNSDLNTAIHRYVLTDNSFRGEINNRPFQLYKLNFNRWDSYIGDYYEYRNDNWRWSY